MNKNSTIFLILLTTVLVSHGQNTFFVSFERVNEFSTVKQYVEQKNNWAINSIEENQSIKVNAPEGDCGYKFNRGKLYQVDMLKQYTKKNGKEALEGIWEYLRVTGAEEVSTFEEEGWKIQTYARANRIIELSVRQKGKLTELGLKVQYIPFAPMEDKSDFAHKAREMESLREQQQLAHKEYVTAYRDSLIVAQAMAENARIEDSIRMANQAFETFAEEEVQQNRAVEPEELYQTENTPAPSGRPAAPVNGFKDDLPPMEDMSHQLFAAPTEDTVSVKAPIAEGEIEPENNGEFGVEEIPENAGFGEETLPIKEAITETPEMNDPIEDIDD